MLRPPPRDTDGTAPHDFGSEEQDRVWYVSCVLRVVPVSGVRRSVRQDDVVRSRRLPRGFDDDDDDHDDHDDRRGVGRDLPDGARARTLRPALLEDTEGAWGVGPCVLVGGRAVRDDRMPDGVAPRAGIVRQRVGGDRDDAARDAHEGGDDKRGDYAREAGGDVRPPLRDMYYVLVVVLADDDEGEEGGGEYRRRRRRRRRRLHGFDYVFVLVGLK